MVEVTLPYGFSQKGGWRHSLWLRPWNGRDESLAGEEVDECPAVRATLLLARCVHLERGGPPASTAFVRRLTAGDRDALLLHLRRITLGGTMACEWKCEQCGETMELELEIERLIGSAAGRRGRMHERTFEQEGAGYTVRFRVPNGGDLEAAAVVARRDAAEAERLVLDRCIEDVRVCGERRFQLPEAVISQLCEAMKELDSQAEVLLEGACCECGEQFQIRCDPAQLVFREMQRRQTARDREVHLLAYHYHWSEGEILGMSVRRRARCVRGLLDSLERRRG